MKNTQSSRSAEGVAIFRAIEAQRPETERICNDFYARAMISSGISYCLVKLVINSGLYELMAPGATALIVGRERYIDDFLKTGLDEGLDQVVILGAGFGKKMRQAARVFGEAYLFGIDQGKVEPFMVRRGFTDIYDVILEDLKYSTQVS